MKILFAGKSKLRYPLRSALKSKEEKQSATDTSNASATKRCVFPFNDFMYKNLCISLECCLTGKIGLLPLKKIVNAGR